MKNKSTNVFFKNFPHDFNEEDNFFINLVEDSKELLTIEKDIYFYGCYPDRNMIKKILLFVKSKLSNEGMTNWLKFQQGIEPPLDPKAFNVWCTFENRRPPEESFDLTYTFDKDKLNGTNYYLPLIYLYLDINGAESKHKFKVSQLIDSRNLSREEMANKTGFVSAFVNNPHPIRMHAIKQLKKYGEVKLFGRSVNNFVEDKISEASKYWFNLCFENDLYPGYVTEKVLEAYLARSIPLYWGDDTLGIINPRAIINLKNFENLEMFTEYISNLFRDKEKMLEMLNEPLFTKDIDYQAIVTHFANQLNASTPK